MSLRVAIYKTRMSHSTTNINTYYVLLVSLSFSHNTINICLQHNLRTPTSANIGLVPAIGLRGLASAHISHMQWIILIIEDGITSFFNDLMRTYF